MDRKAQISGQRRQFMALLRRTVTRPPSERDKLFFEDDCPRAMLQAMFCLHNGWAERGHWDAWFNRRVNEAAEKWEKKLNGLEKGAG